MLWRCCIRQQGKGVAVAQIGKVTLRHTGAQEQGFPVQADCSSDFFHKNPGFIGRNAKVLRSCQYVAYGGAAALRPYAQVQGTLKTMR